MRFQSFNNYKINESWYSVAARMLNSNTDDKAIDFSKPNNNDYIIQKVKIIYPDDACITFGVRENIHSDTETYKLYMPQNDNKSTYFVALTYLSLFGDTIQFDNFEEYTFVRGYLGSADINEHIFNGYVCHSDGSFYEVKIQLSTKTYEPATSTPLEYNLISTLSRYEQVFHTLRNNVPESKKLLYKLKNYLLDGNEIMLSSEIEGIPIVVLLYSNIALNWDYKEVNVCKQILNYMRISSFRNVNMSAIKDFNDLGELFYV